MKPLIAVILLALATSCGTDTKKPAKVGPRWVCPVCETKSVDEIGERQKVGERTGITYLWANDTEVATDGADDYFHHKYECANGHSWEVREIEHWRATAGVLGVSEWENFARNMKGGG